ncbi:MAG: hypothetical protein PHI90_07325 [Clostridia bacterium]|nr:hypothetical protein [Clostridia bacterium]MDD4048612.1 hypothetical protein [Clostridia bacterium]
MSNKEKLINQTKEFLVNQYYYLEDQIETNAELTLLTNEKFIVDMLIKDGSNNPVIAILVTENESREEQIKYILTWSNIQYGIIRQFNNDGSPKFYGWKKKKNLLFDDCTFEEITDYPHNSKGDFLLQLLELFLS